MTPTDLTLRVERVLRHSRRFYLRLCAFCDRDLGLAQGSWTSRARCAHDGALLTQARARLRVLGRAQDEAEVPPDGPPTGGPPRRGGRGRRCCSSRVEARLGSAPLVA